MTGWLPQKVMDNKVGVFWCCRAVNRHTRRESTLWILYLLKQYGKDWSKSTTDLMVLYSLRFYQYLHWNACDMNVNKRDCVKAFESLNLDLMKLMIRS